MKTKMGKYLCEYQPDHPRATEEGYVYVHVLMAEKKLGRFLKDGECVHHVDEDKYNNSIDNLIVFKTKADHTAFHKGSIAEQDGDVWWCPNKAINDKIICTICNKNYKYRNAEMCLECYKKSIKSFIKSSITRRPSRDTLKEQIRNTPFIQIGEKYGVSDNAVRKWCKQYGLPYKSSIIRYISDIDWINENF